MAVQKNQCIPLEITGLTSEGSGVGRYEGEAVFVPGTAPGDRITARIVKDCKRYAYGIVDKLEQPGPGRLHFVKMLEIVPGQPGMFSLPVAVLEGQPFQLGRRKAIALELADPVALLLPLVFQLFPVRLLLLTIAHDGHLPGFPLAFVVGQPLDQRFPALVALPAYQAAIAVRVVPWPGRNSVPGQFFEVILDFVHSSNPSRMRSSLSAAVRVFSLAGFRCMIGPPLAFQDFRIPVI